MVEEGLLHRCETPGCGRVFARKDHWKSHLQSHSIRVTSQEENKRGRPKSIKVSNMQEATILRDKLGSRAYIKVPKIQSKGENGPKVLPQQHQEQQQQPQQQQQQPRDILGEAMYLCGLS